MSQPARIDDAHRPDNAPTRVADPRWREACRSDFQRVAMYIVISKP
jgi:hypothetical protein